MSDINTGQSAFPLATDGGHFSEGMTLRQYAAIKLKVPDSGDDWLDDMIRKSLRDDFAAKAMPIAAGGLNQPREDFVRNDQYSRLTQDAYKLADAMLEAREA
jgi:hypothetical protein